MRKLPRKVAALTSLLFFTLLADAILSFWAPVYMQEVLKSSFLMGMVMSFSSVIGFGADLVFPQLLSGTVVRKLMLMAILSGLLFAGLLFWSTFWPVVAIFLAAMAVWGIYYEFLGFANQQFVAETAPVRERASVWAVMGVFKNLAYFLGPIFGGLLIVFGNRSVVVVAGGISLLAYFLFLFWRGDNKRVVIEAKEINIAAEIEHWWALLPHVWPMLVASFVLGLLDATFWTTGTVFTVSLAQKSFLGGLFLPMYILPSLFVGFLVMKWGVYKGKKKWAEIFMLLAGIILMFLSYRDSIFLELAIVFFSSMLLSISYPLIDAVYSDIVSRMGRERKHLMGLSSSMVSLAYIVGPVSAGWIASRVGERMTFVAMGAALAVVAAMLLVLTPKKLKLPQKEIQSWE